MPRVVIVTAAALLAMPAGAAAVAPSVIHEDAADGSIDGRYSMADLRAADRQVSAEQREYYAWEDVYREHLKDRAGGSSGGGSAPTSAPTSSGTVPGSVQARQIGSAGKGAASEGRRATDDSRTDAPSGGAGSNATFDDSSGDDATATESDSSDQRTTAADSRADGGSSFPVALWLLLALPIAVFITGAWRMRRTRRAAARPHAH